MSPRSPRSPGSPHLYIIGGTAARVSRAVRDQHERTHRTQIVEERAHGWADQFAYQSAYRMANKGSSRHPPAGAVKRPTPAAVEAFHAYWVAFIMATDGQAHISDATRLRLRHLAEHAAQVAQESATTPPRDA